MEKIAAVCCLLKFHVQPFVNLALVSGLCPHIFGSACEVWQEFCIE